MASKVLSYPVRICVAGSTACFQAETERQLAAYVLGFEFVGSNLT